MKLSLRLFLLFLAITCFVAMASGQKVTRRTSGYSSTSRRITRAAEKQGIGDWPNVVEGDSGTQVHVHSDYRNADILLICSKPTKVKDVLPIAKEIASKIGEGNADYITWSGTITSCVDIEMNKNMRRAGRSAAITLDFGGLASALKAAKGLPKPLMVCLDSTDTTDSTLDGSSIDGYHFYSLNDIPPRASLAFISKIEWYAYPAAVVLCMMLLTPLIAVYFVFQSFARKMVDGDKPKARLAPEEVQAKYDRQKPFTRLLSLFPLLFLPLIYSGNGPRGAIQQAFLLLTPGDSRIAVAVMFCYVAFVMFSIPVAMYLARRKARRAGREIFSRTGINPVTSMWPIMVSFLLLYLVIAFPIKILANPEVRFFYIVGVMGAGLGSSVVLSMRQRRRDTKVVPKDDPLFARVKSFGDLAGVRVRKVEIKETERLNAYAGLFGRVGLTSGLLKEMEPEEQNAVIAHEIGHLKAGHVRRTFIYSLLISFGLLFVLFGARYLLEGKVSEDLLRVLTGPMVIFVASPLLRMLLLNKGSRKREHEADQFAAQITGDPELVIRALIKMHTLNEVPHRLRKLDESVSTHPSLEHRIEAIQSAGANTSDGN